MVMTEFALLVIGRVDQPEVYGPFHDLAAAEPFGHTLASPDSGGIAFPIALTPLAAHPLTSRAVYPDGGVVQVPERLVGALIDPADPPVPDGPAVALVVCGEAPHPAIVVGPFCTASEAERWATGLRTVTGSHPATCRIVALEPAPE